MILPLERACRCAFSAVHSTSIARVSAGSRLLPRHSGRSETQIRTLPAVGTSAASQALDCTVVGCRAEAELMTGERKWRSASRDKLQCSTRLLEPCQQLIGGHRAREEVTLKTIAVELSEALCLPLRFNTLGDDSTAH